MAYVEPHRRLIHKGLIGEDGSAAALCADPPIALDADEHNWILSEWLHDEITCLSCLERLGIEKRISRGHLLRNNLEIRLKLAFNFTDAIYWNREVRKPHEPKINPDPDGYLASQFLKLTQEFDGLMQPLRKMMEKHEGQFGWPDLIEKKD